MPFHSRNPYYLRISETNVLPLYVYLDDRHLDWMSDRILQHVLADLRPNIVPKLKAEADTHLGPGGPSAAKRVTVDTHRGDTYQFCYFIRKTEPHSVLIKTGTFVAAPPHKRPQMLPPTIPSSSQPQRAKRKGRARKENTQDPSGNARKRRKTKGKGKARMDGDDAELAISGGDDPDRNGDQNINSQLAGASPRRSRRTNRLVAGGYLQDDENPDADASGTISLDVEMTDQVPETTTIIDAPATPNPDLGDAHSLEERSNGANTTFVKDEVSLVVSSTGITDVDAAINEDVPAGPSPGTIEIDLDIEEEEKPKPMLQLKYQGFSIYGHCLCIVVEPWPPIRSASRSPSVAPTASRAPSIAPSHFVSAGHVDTRLRARTPLFLPDDFDRDRSETPAPFLGQRVLPPVPLFNDPGLAEDGNEDDYEGGGMLEFSQVLNAAGDFRAGAANDDEDMDGAVFFGDADETREL